MIGGRSVFEPRLVGLPSSSPSLIHVFKQAMKLEEFKQSQRASISQVRPEQLPAVHCKPASTEGPTHTADLLLVCLLPESIDRVGDSGRAYPANYFGEPMPNRCTAATESVFLPFKSQKDWLFKSQPRTSNSCSGWRKGCRLAYGWRVQCSRHQAMSASVHIVRIVLPHWQAWQAFMRGLLSGKPTTCAVGMGVYSQCSTST